MVLEIRLRMQWICVHERSRRRRGNAYLRDQEENELTVEPRATNEDESVQEPLGFVLQRCTRREARRARWTANVFGVMSCEPICAWYSRHRRLNGVRNPRPLSRDGEEDDSVLGMKRTEAHDHHLRGDFSV